MDDSDNDISKKVPNVLIRMARSGHDSLASAMKNNKLHQH
jgi:hypothetical protein